MSGETNAKQQPQGVYKNKRLMHACTTIVGSTVHLQTKDGSVWEGIFNTFSPNFTICLDLAVQIDAKQVNNKDSLYEALKSGSRAQKQAFFDLKDIVRITSVDVDLNYATKEAIGKQWVTDSDISGYDPTKHGEHRQLESWQDEDGDAADSMLSLDEIAINTGNKIKSQNNSRGWDAQEMFRYNERVHKVTTTYDEKLTGYTLPLPKHDNEEWRKKNNQAASLAQEIESNQKSQSRLAQEDEGDCEEEKFSAVQRPMPQPINNQVNNPQVTNSQATNHQVTNNQVTNHQVTNHQVTNHQITNNQVNSPQVNSPQVNNPQVNSPQVNNPQVNNPQVSSPQVNNPQVNNPQVTNSQVTSNQMTNDQQQTQQQQNRHLQMNQKTFRNNNRNNNKQLSKIDELRSFASKMTISGPPPRQPPNPLSSSQTELAKKSKLNPYAKEFVYKPRSPAVDPNLQMNTQYVMDPATSSPMAQPGPHAPYGYPQVPIFPHGMAPPHAQHPQFIPNHTHPHFQNQIHYMLPMPTHFAPQMQPQRFVRGQYQNYRPVCDCCAPGWNC